jgi:hypothetical protein
VEIAEHALRRSAGDFALDFARPADPWGTVLERSGAASSVNVRA